MEKKTKRNLYSVLIVFVLIAGILAISFYYLFNAFVAYTSGQLVQALGSTLFAAVGIGVSFYITYTIRKRTIAQKPPPKITTTIECRKCSFKNLRKFERGDYVFKTVGDCQKCNEPMLITAIYAEGIVKK